MNPVRSFLLLGRFFEANVRMMDFSQKVVLENRITKLISNARFDGYRSVG